MEADAGRAASQWPGSTEVYIARLADARATFRPDELRDGWVAVDRHNRPAPAAVSAETVSFRLATAGGARVVDCFLTQPPNELRDRCHLLAGLNTHTSLPAEVIVPRWYDEGLSLDDRHVPILVHTEQRGPTLAQRLSQLQPAEIEELLTRWAALCDDLEHRFGLRHAGPEPHLAFLPRSGVATVHITGWERPPDAESTIDRLTQALHERLSQITPPSQPPTAPIIAKPRHRPASRSDPAIPHAAPQPPSPEPPAADERGEHQVLVVVMSLILAGCVVGLIALWAM